MAIRRPPPPRRSTRRGDGFPAWLIFLVGAAIVFGGFYIWQGAQTFIRTGGLGVEEATQRANLVASATQQEVLATPRATRNPNTPVGGLPPPATAIPDCQEFRVIVPNAIVREMPSTNAAVIDGLIQGTGVCVLGQDAGSEWYTVDGNPDTRRRELAYMHESVIEAAFPTETPTATLTPSITPTIMPSPTISPTETAEPTDTPDPNVSPTRRPSRTPSPTPPPTFTLPPLQSAFGMRPAFGWT
ncbi:MAG: hypothetical protein SF162_15800 [bacterium]|nr:hypothetical protein [bacterium]